MEEYADLRSERTSRLTTHTEHQDMNFKDLFCYKRSLLQKGIIAAFLMCLIACEEPPIESTNVAAREFLIPVGAHYATPKLMETTEATRVEFRATFDESARYELADPSLQSNINKMMGFSDCNSHHHLNSARFGWRWFDNQLEIHAYCYVNSIRVHEIVGTVDINEENHYEISATEDAYLFFLNGEQKVSIPRTGSCKEGLNYMLYPYFGGSVPAPHDVRIKIQILE